MQKKHIWIIAIAAIALLGGGLAIFSMQYFSSGSSPPPNNLCDTVKNASPTGPNQIVTNSSTVHFLIVESDTGVFEGLNGSAYHLSTSWPVLNVQKGQTVVIQVVNCFSSEPHGFAITGYFNSGTTLQPGQSYTLKFVANQVGQFRVYCNVFCAIHPLMQDGLLNVTET